MTARLIAHATLPKINAEISIVMPLNGIGLKICAKSLLTLSNDNITLKNKIAFTAVIIFLVAIIAYLIQQHYFQSYRDSLTPVDYLILFTKPDLDFYNILVFYLIKL